MAALQVGQVLVYSTHVLMQSILSFGRRNCIIDPSINRFQMLVDEGDWPSVQPPLRLFLWLLGVARVDNEQANVFQKTDRQTDRQTDRSIVRSLPKVNQLARINSWNALHTSRIKRPARSARILYYNFGTFGKSSKIIYYYF